MEEAWAGSQLALYGQDDITQPEGTVETTYVSVSSAPALHRKLGKMAA